MRFEAATGLIHHLRRLDARISGPQQRYSGLHSLLERRRNRPFRDPTGPASALVSERYRRCRATSRKRRQPEPPRRWTLGSIRVSEPSRQRQNRSTSPSSSSFLHAHILPTSPPATALQTTPDPSGEFHRLYHQARSSLCLEFGLPIRPVPWTRAQPAPRLRLVQRLCPHKLFPARPVWRLRDSHQIPFAT